MNTTLTHLLYLLTLTWYYVQYGLLYPIAHLFNKSFLIYHPNRIFPTNLAPPRNNTIHSFTPTGEMYRHIMTLTSPPPPLRRWLHPQQLQEHLSQERPLPHAIILEGDLSGPPLRQGTIIIQNGHIVYIRQEFGRWPTRDDYITTTAISLVLNNSFRLFLPIRQMDRYGIIDNSPPSLFRNPLPLAHVIQEAHRLHNSVPSSPTEV